MKVFVEDILNAPNAAASGSSTQVVRRSVLNNKKLAKRNRLTQATLVFSDIVALFTVVNMLIISGLVLGLRLPDFSALLLAFSLFPLSYISFGLYRVVLVRPEREIFSFARANLVVIAGLSVPVMFVPNFQFSMVLWIGIAGPVLLFIVPFFRVLTRSMFSRAAWWGQAGIVIGSGQRGQEVILSLTRNSELGIKPVALLQDDYVINQDHNVPFFNSLNLYHSLAKTHNVQHAVLALSPEEEIDFLENHAEDPVFKKFVVARRTEEGLLYLSGLRQPIRKPMHPVQKWLKRTFRESVKRGLDVTGSFVGIILLAPLFLSIILLNKLTAPGPVFFAQERMGKNGKLFKVLKFRTMHIDAEAKLQHILATDPIRRQEYEIFHKLRDDPRITPIGAVLRRYSLDELPQLFNVLLGDMSMVGPRAYLPRELPKMQGLESKVLQGAPGLTGLWQVSGRNKLSFEERVLIDTEYEKHNSLALDYYILLKTIPVVLTGNGAA